MRRFRARVRVKVRDKVRVGVRGSVMVRVGSRVRSRDGLVSVLTTLTSSDHSLPVHRDCSESDT